MSKLSIIVPARNEPYLNKTIMDVLEKATGNVDIYVVLDGYEPTDLFTHNLVHNIRIPLGDGGCHGRHGINMAVDLTDADFLLKLDAHCLLAKGFDEQLIKDSKENRVQVPRRFRLDALEWRILEDGRPPIDYEFIIFSVLATNKFIWGTKWDDKRGPMIDDVMHFQGSCWFMPKAWFKKCGLMQTEGYGGFVQEPEEIIFKTLKNGGEVKVNKNTSYAHFHKNLEDRKWFIFPEDELKKGYEYSFNKWVIEERELFENLINRFWPIPGWPDNWKQILWPI